MPQKHFSKGMSHSARSAHKERAEPPEDRPLTREEYHSARLAEEAATREGIKRLRANWEVHQAQVKMAEVKRS